MWSMWRLLRGPALCWIHWIEKESSDLWLTGRARTSARTLHLSWRNGVWPIRIRWTLVEV